MAKKKQYVKKVPLSGLNIIKKEVIEVPIKELKITKKERSS